MKTISLLDLLEQEREAVRKYRAFADTTGIENMPSIMELYGRKANEAKEEVEKYRKEIAKYLKMINSLY